MGDAAAAIATGCFYSEIAKSLLISRIVWTAITTPSTIHVQLYLRESPVAVCANRAFIAIGSMSGDNPEHSPHCFFQSMRASVLLRP
jgi:hypothetical protein